MPNGTKWKDRFIEDGYKLAHEGISDARIAGIFKVTPKTIKVWKRDNPEFREAIQKGKDEFICEKGEKSLKKLIEGFKYKEVTREPAMIRVRGKPLPEVIDGYEIRTDTDGKGKILIGMTVTKEVIKVALPNLGAIIFQETNQAPERWVNTKNVQLSGPGGKAIPVTVIDSYQVVPCKCPSKCPECGAKIQKVENDTGPAS